MASQPSPLICLVAPGHLTATPRLIKEAEALTSAGYRVHTVSLDNFPLNRPLDDAILDKATWSATRIPAATGAHGIARRILHRGTQRLPASWLGALIPLAARAKLAESSHLKRVLKTIPADYFLGHCLGSLSAIAAAARHRRVRFGFDLEDFHEAETLEAESNPRALAATRNLLRTYLPAAAHLTAASPLIAEAYERRYHVKSTVVLNVFPRDHAPDVPIEPGRLGQKRPAVLYWFSQTIGPGRGLEATVALLAQVRTPVELHLRGYPAPGYAERLQALATHCRLRHPIVFLPSADPGEMVRLAADADLGLAVEESTPLNRTLCLTNKIFVYLLAGVPQLMSHTAAQAALAPEFGCAAILARLDAPAAVSARIDAFLNDPTVVSAARREAWRLAQTKYCWDVEREKLLASIEHAVA